MKLSKFTDGAHRSFVQHSLRLSLRASLFRRPRLSPGLKSDVNMENQLLDIMQKDLK